jgi:hypothetical protein
MFQKLLATAFSLFRQEDATEEVIDETEGL